MKGELTLQRISLAILGLIMTGWLLTVPPAAEAAQRAVRLNIPGCLS